MDLTTVVSGDSGYSASRLLEPGAEETFASWLADGVVVQDDEPVFYAYRSGRRDDSGFRQGCGIIGVAGNVERLAVTPSFVEIEAPALVDLIGMATGPLLARATDSQGRHHRLWAIAQTSVIETIGNLVSGVEQPVGCGPLVAITPDATVAPIGLVFAFAN